MTREDLNELTGQIIKGAIEVHRIIGPGLLEEAYKVALAHELRLQELKVEVEVPIPMKYKNIRLATAYKADLIIENEIIVELKSVERENPAHAKQLLTYLRLADKRLGLLINFNHEVLREGLRRIVNRF